MNVSIYQNSPRLYHYYTFIRGFPGDSLVKNPSASAGDECSVPELGRSSGEGNGNPLQYSCLGNLMDIRASWAMYNP